MVANVRPISARHQLAHSHYDPVVCNPTCPAETRWGCDRQAKQVGAPTLGSLISDATPWLRRVLVNSYILGPVQ